jgi:hypothetical protein
LCAFFCIWSEPSAAAARAFHFRIPGHPLEDGFVEANKSRGLASGPSSNSTSTSSNSNISDGFGGTVARRAYSANASERKTSPRSVSPRDASASLIRDGERREQVETLDTEGQVVSGTSRAWKAFLARVRAREQPPGDRFAMFVKKYTHHQTLSHKHTHTFTHTRYTYTHLHTYIHTQHM